MATPIYKRILLKLSGEALAGEAGYGLDVQMLDSAAKDLKHLVEMGVEVGLVVGGGNIFRGLAGAASGMDRAKGDDMGMLATVINGLALQDALERNGVDAVAMSAIEMPRVCEPFIRREALRHLASGRVGIFTGGTGSPYFTTDTAAALRANEVKADALLKGTRVDGIYTADPEKDPTATRYDHLTYMEALAKQLRVMDSTAFSLCMDNDLPIVVYDMRTPGNTEQVLLGEPIGTTVSSQPKQEQ